MRVVSRRRSGGVRYRNCLNTYGFGGDQMIDTICRAAAARWWSPSMRARLAACWGVMPRVQSRQAVSVSSSTRAAGCGGGGRCRLQRPASRVQAHSPAPGPGQCPHEGVDDRAGVAGAHEPRLAGRVADLLVVGPVLGEVPGGVQPDGSWPGAGPAHRLAQGVRVDGLPELCDLVPGGLELVGELARAD